MLVLISALCNYCFVPTLNKEINKTKNAYGFSSSSLKLMVSYLSNRFQRVKVGSVFSEWLNILLGVPEGFILGPS